MNNWLLWGGTIAGVMGILTGAWGKIKAVLTKLRSQFIETAELGSDNVSTIALSYLADEFWYSRAYVKKYAEFWAFIHTEKRNQNVLYEHLGGRPIVFWKGWKPMLYTPKIQTSGATTAASLMCVRKMFNISDILKQSFDVYQERRREGAGTVRFKVVAVPGGSYSKDMYAAQDFAILSAYRPINFERSDLLFKRNGHRAIDELVLNEGTSAIYKEIERWKNSRDFYERHHIPWKHGILFYGKPGTGKTAIIRAVASDLDMPIFNFRLAEMDNAQFVEEWNKLHESAPCIALMEDFDNVFNGRDNITSQNPLDMFKSSIDVKPETGDVKKTTKVLLSFGTILNCLDGIDKSEGVLTLITTNDISKIDEAIGIPRAGTTISTRPGRINRAIELGYLSPEGKEQLARRILHENKNVCREVLSGIPQRGDETPAQFQFYCTQLALQAFWSKGS